MPVVWAARLFSVAWSGLAILAPLLAAVGLAGPARRLYQLQHLGCNQLPGHSIWICNHPTALCARHLGIYTMMGVGTVAPRLWQRLRHDARSLRWLIAGCVPVALDGGLDMAGLWHANLMTRVVTGAVAGVSLGVYLGRLAPAAPVAHNAEDAQG